ncbi:hypothetical protein [Lactobacillus intestinalis]|uniref:hypothetical protein n=1 Tax=Lactobacillus intestinalis TaxID=151781 RepID=UPI0012B8D3DB|nr:hypothetical protein [Lactobacillus intestinalis]
MSNKVKKILALVLVAILGVNLAACSDQKKKAAATTPSAQTILTKAQNTNLKNMKATWKQTSPSGQILQKASAKYSKKPLVVYANFTTNSNHYKMWIENKTNYIQMQGTDTNKWFKTKLTKASSYAQLTDDLAKSTLLTLSTSNANLFKTKQTKKGYEVYYHGNNKKLWNEIIQNSPVTSVIGVDLNKAKPKKINIKIRTNKDYTLKSVSIGADYTDGSKDKKLSMKINDINKLKKLEVPASIKKNAVNLGNMAK